jgi:toxin ParE1/3/4
MAEYRLSPAAERDLEGIWKYTRREWGLDQAERYTDFADRGIPGPGRSTEVRSGV